MEGEVRKSGIGVLGAVPWGTHICYFYHTKQDLIDVLVPYFQAGLENNERCIWITSKNLKVKEAEEAMRQAVPDFSHYLESQQIEIIPHTEWYLKGGTFNRERVFNTWAEKLQQALPSGYDGVRVTGDISWLKRGDWHEFISYEEEANSVVGKYKVLAICTYPLHKINSGKIIDVERSHQYSLVKHKDNFVLIGSSGREQGKESLREIKERFRIASEIASDVVYERDMKKGVATFYGDIDRHLGYEPGEYPRTWEGWREHVHPEDLTRIESVDMDQLKPGVPYRIEYRMRKKDGTYMTWHDSIILISDEKTGKPLKFIGVATDITESKRAEEKQQAIVETAIEGFWIVNLEGKFLEVNDSYCQMTGYTREELLKMSIPDIEALEKHEDTAQHIKRVMEQGSDHFETRHKRKDGKIINVEVKANYLDLGEGQMFGSIRDITERRRTEEALLESEEKYRAVFEKSSDSIVLMNAENHSVADFNERACRNLGYSREEFAGLKLDDIEAVESDAEIWEHREKVDREGKDIFETKHRTKDGQLRDVLVSVRPLHTGGKSFVLNIWHYITEREPMDKVLLASEQRYWEIFQGIGEAVLVIGKDERFLDCNEAVLKMLGYSREEFLNLTLTDIVHPHFHRSLEDKRRGSWNGETVRFESAYCTKDGRKIPVEVVSTKIDYQGKQTVLTAVRDITERSQAAEAYGMLSRPASGRPLTELQQRFIREGFKEFEDREIIELLLSLVLPARKSRQLAGACMERFQNLRDFLAASTHDLERIGITAPCMFCIKLLHELPTEVLRHNILERSVYKSSREIFDYLYYSMRDLKVEVFKMIYLNNRSQIIDTTDLFEGTADYIHIRPREIVESAITHGAAGLIFVHNHPTGDPSPSRTDKQLTRDLVFVGEILQIKVLDHIIIGENCYFSFADDGLIKKYENDFLDLKMKGVLASGALYIPELSSLKRWVSSPA